MQELNKHVGRIATGTTLGGLVVGASEAFAYDVSPWYAAFLYGAIWAVLGSCLAAVCYPLARRKPLRHGFFTWGLALSTASSAFLLVRFFVIRNVLHEVTERSWIGTAAGALCAVMLALAVFLAGRSIRQRFVTANKRAVSPWLLPASVFAVFVVIAFRPIDTPKVASAAKAPAASGKGQGVILIVADALRADVLGAYGAAKHRDLPPSPHFDALAKQSSLFTDFSAQASWTKPTMASVMSSRYVSGHGTMSKAALLPHNLPILAEVLQKQGVKTGAVVTNYNLEAGFGFARGFDTFHYLAPDRYLNAPERANRLAAYNVYRLLRERFWKRAREMRHFYQSGELVNARALEFIDTVGDSNFFLWLHYMEPHDPYFDADGKTSWARVALPHPKAADAAPMLLAYRDGVRRFDDALGQLLAALEQRGWLDQVALVVTADHGEEFDDHGGFYHGVTLYEEQLHIPLLIKRPDALAFVDQRLARQIDIAPTIAAHLRVQADSSWEGRELLSDTQAPQETLAEEDHEGNVLTAYRRVSGGKAVKIITSNPDNPRGLRPVEVFDVASDPKEQYPLPVSNDVVDQLQKALVAFKTQQKQQGTTTAPEKPLTPEAEAELRSLGYVQ